MPGASRHLFFAAVVGRRLAPGSDTQLRQRLVRFTLIELRLVLRNRIVVARTADDRPEEDQEEGECEAGQPNADALRASPGMRNPFATM